jgi:hypothetical protein
MFQRRLDSLFVVLFVVACGSGSENRASGTGGTAGAGGAGGGTVGGGSGGTIAGRPDASLTGTGGARHTTDGGQDLPGDAGTIEGLTLKLERSTPEQIGLYLPVTGTVAADSRATVRYKRVVDPDWRVAHPLFRIRPAEVTPGAPEMPVDSFAGTIFDLTPGTSYDVEITLAEPGQPAKTLWTVVTTRALPPAAPAATVTAKPTDDLQAKFAALKPGDVLELADGTYDASGLFLASSGTEAQRIYIRGTSRGGVILRSPTGNVLQIQVASHVVIENLTLEGSGVDSGTDSSSHGVSFWNGGAAQEDVTLRDLDINGVDMGIVASGTVRGVLVYNSALHGNNVWTKAFIETNLTWNDDGIRLPGEGNCAFENTLHGFGDSLAVIDGVHSAAVYFYRNRITMTGDDAFEADYGTRNLALYDNYITNSSTFLSLDPLWGGPLYCFRNVSINALRGPFKLNNTNTGFLVYNNTIVRTEGTTGWGWVQFNNGALRSWSYRNNILIYRGSGNLLAVESTGNDPIDFTNNAWYPDKAVWWTTTGGSFANLAAARAGVPATSPLFGTSTSRHEGDVITVSDPFTSPITLGPDHLTEVGATAPPALSPGVSAKNAGAEIPNITDGHAGAAPDMGAIIEGRPVPRWGATRP